MWVKNTIRLLCKNSTSHLLANIDDWQISKDANNRRLRDAAYVIPPQPSDSETV